jgi:hypothetical protein
MYSRVTQLEIDTLRIDLDRALAIYRERVVPMLREQEGYEGAYVFANADGKGVLITFWETEESASATPFYVNLMTEFVTMFRSPPGRESYEVLYADAPTPAF